MDLLSNDLKLEIILPKLSLSGVKLSTLKNNSIKPVIGPIYIDNIPNFLDNIPHKSRTNDKYEFKISDRIFTLIPSLVQINYYSIFVFIGLFLLHYFLKTKIWWQTIPIMLSSTF